MATRLPIEDVASTARVTVAALHTVLLVEEPVAMTEILLDLERARMTAEDQHTRVIEMRLRITQAITLVASIQRSHHMPRDHAELIEVMELLVGSL